VSNERQTSLSVLVPVFNEQYLVATSLERLRVLETSPELSRIEVIVVDDCSRDDTAQVLEAFRRKLPAEGSKMSWKFLSHAKNQGKGKAVQTALAEATCDITVIHDADLEYHPKDLLRIVRVFLDEEADAVFGSRFAGSEVRRAMLFRHELGNRLLTFLTNLVTNINLTDMETCYKAVRTELLKSIPLCSNDFRLEPELTIKLAKREARIYEVPISYSGRTYAEGKKINWRDGFRALAAIARFAISDAIYREDQYGSQILARLSRGPRLNAWMADVIRPFCGNRVLEIGSGVGNLSRQLIPRRKYVVSDVNPLYLRILGKLPADRPYVKAVYCDVTDLSTYPRQEGPYDTVICLNVLERVKDDRGALRNIRATLTEDGRAIVLVPNGPWNFGTLDQVLGHQRRYTRDALRRLAEESGFEVGRVLEFNRVASLGWWFNGKILRRKTFGSIQRFLLNVLAPLLRIADRIVPIPPLSLIAVMTPRPDPAADLPRKVPVAG
jgi:glycosyltransferase involved in cell wall biosynthesis